MTVSLRAHGRDEPRVEDASASERLAGISS
jgi:hypothetical protein